MRVPSWATIMGPADEDVTGEGVKEGVAAGDGGWLNSEGGVVSKRSRSQLMSGVGSSKSMINDGSLIV